MQKLNAGAETKFAKPCARLQAELLVQGRDINLASSVGSSYKDILNGQLDILKGHRTFYMDIGHS